MITYISENEEAGTLTITNQMEEIEDVEQIEDNGVVVDDGIDDHLAIEAINEIENTDHVESVESNRFYRDETTVFCDKYETDKSKKQILNVYLTSFNSEFSQFLVMNG